MMSRLGGRFFAEVDESARSRWLLVYVKVGRWRCRRAGGWMSGSWKSQAGAGAEERMLAVSTIAWAVLHSVL
ncbi:hypothetical protein BCR44DRAFT_1423101, partial [Catenaria anguillulae PL171]